MDLDYDFFDAFSTSISSAYTKCACGKTHFDGNLQYDSETNDELMRLADLQPEYPEKYQCHDGSITEVRVDGKNYVPDCTCEIIEKYKNFIDRDAEEIASYLNKKSKRLLDKAKNIAVKD